MLSVGRITLVKDYQLNEKNIAYVKRFLRDQLAFYATWSLLGIGRPDWVNSKTLKIFVNQIRRITGLSENEIVDYLSHHPYPAEDPIHRQNEILSNLDNPPQDLFWIVVKYNDQTIASIMFFYDPRSTLFGESLGFFIGIFQTMTFYAARDLSKRLKVNPEIVDIKVSDLIIPYLEELARKEGYHYIATLPLQVMHSILEQHGFQTTHNQIENSYRPPCELMLWRNLILVYKKLT